MNQEAGSKRQEARFEGNRVKLILQYKGTRYYGWQVQPNGPTIQEILERALFKIFQQKVHVVGSGRTDSGVHALGQVAHADVPGKRTSRLLDSINHLLPHDVAVTAVEVVPLTFHAQKSARHKIYDYLILNSFIRSPFLGDYVWQTPKKLNIPSMRQAARLLVGEHDFKTFCASDTSVMTTTRRIDRLAIRAHTRYKRLGTSDGRLIQITIEGNGFLKHMVRNIVGSLVDVGKGRMTLTQFRQAFRARDRRRAGICAPARGLILREVIY